MGSTINRNKGTLFVAFLLLSCFIISEISCSSLSKKASHPVELKVPVKEKIILTGILAKNARRLQYFEDLKAFAEISIQYQKKKIKRKNIIIFRNDQSVRFEVLSITGTPFIYFISNKEETSIYYPDSNVLLKGPYSPKNIARIIGVNLELEDIVTNLSGNFAIFPQLQTIILYESNDYFLIKLFLGDQIIKEIYIDKETYLPLKLVKYNSNDMDIMIVHFSDYKKINNYFLPFVIKIESPQKKIEIFLRYNKVKLNQGVSDSSFVFPINKDMQIMPLEN